jgi:importin subunit alpha-6/7
LTQLTGTDSESQCDACFAVSYISDGENSRIQAIIDANLLPPIAHLLAETENQTLKSAALRVIGNVLTGDESQTQSVLNLNVLPTLCNLLHHPKSRIRKETCWSISNITAGNVNQIQAVIDAQIIPKLLAMGYRSTSDICKECLWCLANATEQKDFKQLQYFIGKGLIPFLAWNLSNSTEPQLLSVVLSAIHNIIQTNGNGNGNGEGEGGGEGDTAEVFHELVAVATGARLKQLKQAMGSHPDISTLLDSIFEKLRYPLPEDDLPSTDDLAAPAPGAAPGAAATEEEEEEEEEEEGHNDQLEELDVVMDLI